MGENIPYCIGMWPKGNLRGVESNILLADGQACPRLSSFQQGFVKIYPREGLFWWHLPRERGHIMPIPPPIVGLRWFISPFSSGTGHDLQCGSPSSPQFVCHVLSIYLTVQYPLCLARPSFLLQGHVIPSHASLCCALLYCTVLYCALSYILYIVYSILYYCNVLFDCTAPLLPPLSGCFSLLQGSRLGVGDDGRTGLRRAIVHAGSGTIISNNIAIVI